MHPFRSYTWIYIRNTYVNTICITYFVKICLKMKADESESKYLIQNPRILLKQHHRKSNVKANLLWFSAKSRKLPLNVKRFDRPSPIIPVYVIATSIRWAEKPFLQLTENTRWNQLSQSETFQQWDHEISFHPMRVNLGRDIMH